MTKNSKYDAVIVGAGPNGLAAALRLAQQGARVQVIEAGETIGGGTRTKALTLKGYLHDVCSAIHPLGVASPYLRQLPLDQFGLEWIYPEIPLAHPLDNGEAVLVHQSVEATAAEMGIDTDAYKKYFGKLLNNWQGLLDDLLGPLPLPPKHPLTLTRFGMQALRSAKGFAQARFRGTRARAVFAGMSAHSILPLERPGSAAFGLMLHLLAHGAGWPMARGGSQRITEALAAYLKSLQGEIIVNKKINTLDELPSAGAVLFNLSPRGVLRIAENTLTPAYRRQLRRYRYGPGICKVDWALDGPVPWANPDVGKAGTVHLGGKLEEIVWAEKEVWDEKIPENPFVLLAQHSIFDPTRAPKGKHTAWAYCHVPHNSGRDISDLIEKQVERFAPGFRKRILARHVFTAEQMEIYNANYVGGDINGGIQDLRQLFTRPALRLNPYRIPVQSGKNLPRMYLCSSSTPPGGGVHGMCGFHAAETVLRDWKE